jgi:tetratricopeptide (TPR) repeat protein
VLFQALTGEPPFTGPTPQAVLARRLIEPVPELRPLSRAPRAVELAIGKALAREPGERFDSVADFLRALDAADAEGVAAPAKAGRHRRTALIGIGVLLAAGLAGLALVRGHSEPASFYDPDVVAVLPARLAASDHNRDYLREGFVDLAAARLTGEGGPRAADPRTTLAALRSVGEDQPDALARRLKAGRVLDGSIVANGRHLTLSASLISYPGGARQAPVSVEGSEDSIGVLVDRLMIQVLALHAGLHPSALSSVTSLPAWRSYLAGKAAYRAGRYTEAATAFDQAVAADSTFALAMLEDIAARSRAGRDPTPRVDEAGRSLHRLGPADSLWFLVLAGPHYPRASSRRDQIAFIDSASSRLADRPDVWFELGDLQLHTGGSVDLEDHLRLAKRSFAQALALDSSFALAIEHLLFVAYNEQDTTSIRRLMPLLQAHDSAGDRSGFFRWRSAVALGDSATVLRERSRFLSLPADALRHILAIPQGDGVGLGDAILADSILSTRDASEEGRADSRLRHGLLQLTLGRAGPSPLPIEAAPIINGLLNDGDPEMAERAVATLRARGPLRGRVVERDDYLNRYALGLWDLSQGQLAEARSIIGELRAHEVRPVELRGDEQDPIVSTSLLETWLAMAEHSPAAAQKVQSFDSLMATGPPSFVLEETMLLLGRWYMELHQPAAALRVLKRSDADLLLPFMVCSRALARARVATSLSDTVEASRAYRLYLALRYAPDARLVPQRDSARQEYAALLQR